MTDELEQSEQNLGKPIPAELKVATDAVRRCLDSTDLFALEQAADQSPEGATRLASIGLSRQRERYMRLTKAMTGRLSASLPEASILAHSASQAKELTELLEQAESMFKHKLWMRKHKQSMTESFSPAENGFDSFVSWLHGPDKRKQMASLAWADTIDSFSTKKIRELAKQLAVQVGENPTGVVSASTITLKPLSNADQQPSGSDEHDDSTSELLKQPSSASVAANSAKGPEQIDANGYVAQPFDPSVFKPAAEIMANHIKGLKFTLTGKKLSQIVENYSENRIRWTRPIAKKAGKPHSKRRSIHLTDWLNYVERAKPTDSDWPELEEEEKEARTADIRNRKRDGK